MKYAFKRAETFFSLAFSMVFKPFESWKFFAGSIRSHVSSISSRLFLFSEWKVLLLKFDIFEYYIALKSP